MLPEIKFFKDKIESGELAQDRVHDQMGLSKVLKVAIGELSMRDFSVKTNLNQTFLSRLKNCQINRPLSIEELYAIANSNEADEDAAKSLMLAQPPENVIMDTTDIIMDVLLFYNGMDWQATKNTKDAEVREFKRSIRAVSKISNVSNMVAYSLLNSGYAVSLINGNSSYKETGHLLDIRNMFGGVIYHIDDTEPEFHWFGYYIEDEDDEDKSPFLRCFKTDIIDKYGEDIAKQAEDILMYYSDLFMLDLLNPAYLETASYSFLIKDKNLFEAVCELLNPITFNNTFSAILVDTQQGNIVKDEVFFNRHSGTKQESVFL